MSPVPRSLVFSRATKLLLGLVALLLVTAIVFSKRSTSNSIVESPDRVPSLVLWAWERPEQLEFIDTSKVGVAFLAQTIYLRGAKTVVRPRLQPLKLPNDAALVAVTRIESDRKERPELTTEQIEQTASAVSELAKLSKVVAVQIDFDATLSERDFYRKFLFQIRRQLPAPIALSITALASWCKGDNWLDDLPVDEAVPMLFRMGINENQIRSQVMSGEPFSSVKCQKSLGLSTDEPMPGVRHSQRTYFFNPRSWTANSVNEVLKHHETQISIF